MISIKAQAVPTGQIRRMMRAPILLLALTLASPASACPGGRVATVADPTLVPTLIAWIGAHTGYETARTRDAPPSLATCETGEEIAYEGDTTTAEPGIRALYDSTLRRIYLVEPWSAEVIEDQARLLHELIHDVQHLNAEWRCPQEVEWEAYRLTADWLEEHGAAPDFDWFEIYLLSRCPSDRHP